MNVEIELDGDRSICVVFTPPDQDVIVEICGPDNAYVKLSPTQLDQLVEALRDVQKKVW